MDSIKQDVLNYLNGKKLSYIESFNQENYNAYKTNLQRIIQDINTEINPKGYSLLKMTTSICSAAPTSYGGIPANPTEKIYGLILQNDDNDNERATINIQFSSGFGIIPPSGGANKKSKRRTKSQKGQKENTLENEINV